LRPDDRAGLGKSAQAGYIEQAQHRHLCSCRIAGDHRKAGCRRAILDLDATEEDVDRAVVEERLERDVGAGKG
jgi:hypothetical protein